LARYKPGVTTKAHRYANKEIVPMNKLIEEQPILGGTDGFRAIATDQAGPGLMNPETVAGLTRSLVEHQYEAGMDGPVVIAQDTRPSGNLLRQAAILGAQSAGAEIVDTGILPTPAAQKIANRLGALATVVITASHNPWTDNGWKGMLGSRKPSGVETRVISARYWRHVLDRTLPDGASFSKPATESTPHTEWYINEVVEDISHEFGMQPLANRLFVIDGARGAARLITPEVFRRLGARVETFACDSEGYVNDGCGAASLNGLRDFLRARPDVLRDSGFLGAIANDGDADRVMGVGVNNTGELVDITGNHSMEMLALQPLQPGIVGTVYTNSAVPIRLQKQAIDFAYCDNGDTHVTNALLAKQAEGQDWQRGGEFTGHLIDTLWLGSGDGVRTAAWMAAYASRNGQTFGDIAQILPMWPERMERVALPNGYTLPVETSSAIQTALSQVRELGARPVVRASGTEPVVRIWCEAPEADLVNTASNMLRTSVVNEMEKR
jgi:phosphoglucosamine mutase